MLSPSVTSRRGLTLLEVVLVVGVLVVIASLASPTLIRMLESQQLRRSSDLLRAQFARTRLLAMKTGRIQMFRYQFSAGGYQVQPWYASDDALETSDQQAGQNPLVQSTPQDMVQDRAPTELPDGIVFLAGETQSDQRSTDIDMALAQELSREQVWSPPILFYPDGTSSSAVVALANRRRQIIEVSLRGITGMSQASDMTRLAEVVP